MLPELDRQRIKRWVESRNNAVPEPARALIRYELDLTATSATVLECRPPWPIARLRYTQRNNLSSLSWRDRNLRFHLYDLVAPSPHVEDLLNEIDLDPTAIFSG